MGNDSDWSAVLPCQLHEELGHINLPSAHIINHSKDLLLFQEVERISKELVGERSRLEVVSRDFKEMETTNISLKQLVHSTQDALSKEQNLVKSFQEQLQDNKVKLFDDLLIYFCFVFN